MIKGLEKLNDRQKKSYSKPMNSIKMQSVMITKMGSAL